MNFSHLKNAVQPGVFAAVLAAGLFAPVFSSAEGTNDVSTRIELLENQTRNLSLTLDALTGTIDDSSMSPADAGQPVLMAQSRDVAQLNVRLANLEEQMRVLTGQVEGLQFQMTQYQTLIERMQEDIDFRFGQIDPSLGKTEAVTPTGSDTLSGGLPQVNDQAIDTNADAPLELGAPLDSQTDLPDQTGINTGLDTSLDNGIDADFDAGMQTDGAPMDFGLDEEGDLADLEGPSPLGPGFNLNIEGQGIGLSLDPQPLDLDFGASQLVTDGDADAQYRAGYDAVIQGDYAFAEAQFRQFVALFPTHPLAPDATAWLGEALLQRGEYGDAAQTLFDGFQRYEGSTRAPDLLLKLGVALAGADERETACRTFAEVLRRYPENGAAFTARVQQEQANAQC